MNYAFQITNEEKKHLLKIKRRVAVQDIPTILGECYSKIVQYMHEVSASMSGAPFVAYYNMDMNDLEIDIVIPVATEIPGKGDIEADILPAGEYISTLHIGPYSTMEPAYHAITEYIQTEKLEITGVAYEFYLNDPSEVPESELQTRIMFRIL